MRTADRGTRQPGNDIVGSAGGLDEISRFLSLGSELRDGPWSTAGYSARRCAGDATDRIEPGIANKYLCEMLSTTLPNRKPTDTRHFISYDAKTQKFTAWWFNDTSYHPTALSGDLAGNRLVLMSDPSAPGPVLRATYESPTPDKLTFLLEMKNGENWTRLFLTTYSKKTSVAKQ